ncbi:MAG: dTMP kinase [Bacteroidales bacterium]|jgi:dTMP kinase|nr:dTMP kinase [Bacteroidales bacterium]
MGFIVIEGLDGAGKSTQLDLLTKFLRSKNKNVEYIHFPTMNSPIFGDLIARFLRGEFGGINDVNPYLVALLFAGDRYNLANTISDWIKNNKIVINDRYVYSNIGFQCAKMNSEKEQDKLFNWILDMEYNYFKIPKPDLSIFLDVPFEFTKKRLEENRKGEDREYLQGKTDIHEADLIFQNNVRNTYLKAIEKDENFIRIDCSGEGGKILQPEIISQKIIDQLQIRSLI